VRPERSDCLAWPWAVALESESSDVCNNKVKHKRA
jgi:hypothetical protein